MSEATVLVQHLHLQAETPGRESGKDVGGYDVIHQCSRRANMPDEENPLSWYSASPCKQRNQGQMLQL
jgi:hypothetical protein